MKSTTLATTLLLLGLTSAAPSPKRPCTPSEIALATGIHLNINGQYAEYNATQAIENIEQQTPSGPTPAFYKAQGVLQGAVQEGMNLRLFNQQIAPQGNPAIPGLAAYAAAEEVEKAQAAGLTGVYARDGAVLEALKGEILSGIALNEGNLKAAVSECDFTLQFPPANEMGVWTCTILIIMDLISYYL